MHDCNCRKQTPFVEALLDVVDKDLVRHPSSVVRASSVSVLNVAVVGMSASLLSSRVLPTLSTLAVDTDKAVRAASIDGYAAVVENAGDTDVLEAAANMFQSFIEELPWANVQHVLRAFMRVAPRADPMFRDEFVLPTLQMIAENSAAIEPKTARQDALTLLIECYQAVSCICTLKRMVVF